MFSVGAEISMLIAAALGLSATISTESPITYSSINPNIQNNFNQLFSGTGIHFAYSPMTILPGAARMPCGLYVLLALISYLKNKHLS